MWAKKIEVIKKELAEGKIVPKELSVSPGNMLKYQNPHELVALTEEYIKECQASGDYLTLEGLALKLWDDSWRLRNYKNKDEYKPIIDYYKRNILAQQTKAMMKDPKMLPAIKYYLENNFPDKYSSKTVQDINLTGNISLSKLADLAEAKLQGNIVEGEIVK